jgi:hypothetical protein
MEAGLRSAPMACGRRTGPAGRRRSAETGADDGPPGARSVKD